MCGKTTIVIENNDKKIWARDRMIMDLLQSALRKDQIVVDLNGEGPCAESLGLYDILDEICNRTSLSKNKISVHTFNLLESHEQYQIIKYPPVKHISDLQNMLVTSPLAEKNIQKHFGHFIGHSSRFRLVIASWLQKHHRDKSRQTFHSSPTAEMHREFISLEDLWFNNYSINHIYNAVELLDKTPFKYDAVDQGPILHMKMYGILGAYTDVFVDIVCNTYVSGSTFYVDEKMWRPIITKTPFIVHGPRNFIKNFRKLGFRTFDRWWDEGFSEDSPDCQARAIIDIIDQLAKYSLDDIKNLYQEMKPILDHNYDVFMSLSPRDFEKSFERAININNFMD